MHDYADKSDLRSQHVPKPSDYKEAALAFIVVTVFLSIVFYITYELAGI